MRACALYCGVEDVKSLACNKSNAQSVSCDQKTQLGLVLTLWCLRARQELWGVCAGGRVVGAE